MADVERRTRVVEFDAERIECLSGRDSVHDRLCEGTAAQDVEMWPLSDNIANFCGMIVVGGAREKGGERSHIGTEVGEIGEDCEFGGYVIRPADKEEGDGSYAWACKVFDKGHAWINQVGHLQFAPYELVEIRKQGKSCFWITDEGIDDIVLNCGRHTPTGTTEISDTLSVFAKCHPLFLAHEQSHL